VLYDDSVRVPADAAPGPATLRIELTSNTGKVSVPTEIPATIVR
jgi:hypothetical protein